MAFDNKYNRYKCEHHKKCYLHLKFIKEINSKIVYMEFRDCPLMNEYNITLDKTCKKDKEILTAIMINNYCPVYEKCLTRKK